MFTLNYKMSETGGALVETALLMMIFVPLIMYVMFIGDAMFHLLEIQETAVASIWDYSTAPFGVNNEISKRISATNGQSSIDHHNKWQFVDHESSYTNFDNLQGMTNDERHHNTPFLDTTWVATGTAQKDSSYNQYYNKNATQVVCQKQGDRSFSLANVFGGTNTYASRHAPSGGNYVCWAKGFVLNKILPRNFMPEFIKTEVFSGAKYASGDAHGNAGTAAENQQAQEKNGGSDLFMFFRARAALLADSWAALADHLDSHKDYKIEFTHDFWGPSQTQDFYKRVNVYFSAGGGLLAVFNALKTLSIVNYQAKLATEHLAAPLLISQPSLLWLAATYSHSGKNYKATDYTFKPTLNFFGKKHYTTSSEAYLKQAETDREEYYLGWQQTK